MNSIGGLGHSTASASTVKHVSNAALLYNQIQNLSKSGKAPALARVIDEYCDCEPVSRDNLQAVAGIAYSQRLYRAAAHLYERAISAGLRNYRTYFKAGQAHWRCGAEDQALSCFLKALNQRSRCVHTRFAIGHVFHQKAKNLAYDGPKALFERTRRMANHYYATASEIYPLTKTANAQIELEGLVHAEDEASHYPWDLLQEGVLFSE